VIDLSQSLKSFHESQQYHCFQYAPTILAPVVAVVDNMASPPPPPPQGAMQKSKQTVVSMSCAHRTAQQQDGKLVLFGRPLLIVVNQSNETGLQLKQRLFDLTNHLCDKTPRVVVTGPTGLRCGVAACKNKQCTGLFFVLFLFLFS
jgi:hypothetical protein